LRVFYGWWMVAACLAVATIGWGLGLFGSSVYLHALARDKGWSIGLISGAITLYYLASAPLLVWVGSSIARRGPRAVIGFGAVAMGLGVASLGWVSEPWHVYLSFLAMGVGWACLSTTAVTTTLAPWFERHQGRAASTALLGASVGGIVAAPSLVFAIDRLGFAGAMLAAGALALVVVLPLAFFVLRRRPQDLGLLPDGETLPAGVPAMAARRWTRAEALRTGAFSSVAAAFGLGLMVQIGFLTHHVSFLAPSLGAAGAASVVTATAISAFVGRLGLARLADRVDNRRYTAGMMLLAAATLLALALFPDPAVLVLGSVVYGFTVGNITTMTPIIVRREFGAASFGAVYGAASMAVGLLSGLGPAFYGALHDVLGGYGAVLLIAAAVEVVSAACVLLGRPAVAETSPPRPGRS
jgi:MFS family permease